MSDEYYTCKCGFKCVLGQLSKTDGYCPKCNNGREDIVAKHATGKWLKKPN